MTNEVFVRRTAGPSLVYLAISIFIPLCLLLLYFHLNYFDFQNDDFQHWGTAIYWKSLFEKRPFLDAVWQVLATDRVNVSFYQLIGSGFLFIGKDIEMSTKLFSLSFMAHAALTCFFTFRRKGLDPIAAFISSTVICTYPFLIGMSYVFMAELPFCAISFSAIACLYFRQSVVTSILFFLAFLIRPFEGAILAPALIAYALDARSGDGERYFRSVIGGLILAAIAGILAYSFRWKMLMVWLNYATASPDQAYSFQKIRFGLENIYFLGHALYLSFGLVGILMALSAFFIAIRGRRERPHAWKALTLLLMLPVITWAAISLFQNEATRWMFSRYSLASVLFFLMYVCMILFQTGIRWGWRVLPVLFACINIWICILGAMPNGKSAISDSYFEWNMVPFHWRSFPGPSRELADEIKRLVPRNTRANVMMVGRDKLMISWPELTLLRLYGDWSEVRLQKYFPDYVRNALSVERKEGPVRLRRFYVDVVVFEKKGKNINEPFPSIDVVDPLERGHPEELGLELTKSISWTWPGEDNRTIEVYMAK